MASADTVLVLHIVSMCAMRVTHAYWLTLYGITRGVFEKSYALKDYFAAAIRKLNDYSCE